MYERFAHASKCVKNAGFLLIAYHAQPCMRNILMLCNSTSESVSFGSLKILTDMLDPSVIHASTGCSVERRGCVSL